MSNHGSEEGMPSLLTHLDKYDGANANPLNAGAL